MQIFCQTHPDVLELVTPVLAARPGAVLLASSPVFPGGGTHLDSTGQARAVKVLKAENKGRRSRRIKLGLVG